MRRHALSAIAIAVIAAPTTAQFTTPDQFGWTRADTDATYVFWSSFVAPTGGNPPGAELPDPRPAGFVTPDVVALNPGTFVTGSFNLYSFDDQNEIEATFPQFARRGGYVTRVLVQVSTLGTEIDPATIEVDGIAPAETIELNRVFLGDGVFGGFIVDQQLVFEVPGNGDSLVFRFKAAESSLSLDQLSIDALPDLRGCNRADIAEPFGVVSQADVQEFVAAFFANSPLIDYAEPFGIATQSDVAEFVDLFFGPCP